MPKHNFYDSNAISFDQSQIQTSLLFIEEFNNELTQNFNEKHLKPYFNSLFEDLALRSPYYDDSKVQSIDKVILFDFINLPGILSDRFYALISTGN